MNREREREREGEGEGEGEYDAFVVRLNRRLTPDRDYCSSLALQVQPVAIFVAILKLEVSLLMLLADILTNQAETMSQDAILYNLVYTYIHPLILVPWLSTSEDLSITYCAHAVLG